jgi:hypothetical protein
MNNDKTHSSTGALAENLKKIVGSDKFTLLATSGALTLLIAASMDMALGKIRC